jgi:hypothetical protein
LVAVVIHDVDKQVIWNRENIEVIITGIFACVLVVKDHYY